MNLELFLNKIELDTNGCWNWTGSTWQGYGKFKTEGRVQRAPRVAYLYFFGAIPDGYQLDHLCRNRGCVNPTHLEPVPYQVNYLRGNGAPAINARKTHCLRGHEFTEENTKISNQGKRLCRECLRVRSRERSRNRSRVLKIS